MRATLFTSHSDEVICSNYRVSHRYAGERFVVYCKVLLPLRDLQLLAALVCFVQSEKYAPCRGILNGSCCRR